MGIDTKTYIALSVVMFLEYAVWGAWAPVLAARLLGPLKMTGKQTGWIYATLPIACIISPLVAGWLADQYFDMKWILIVAHLVGAVLLFVAAKQSRFAPLLVVMFLYSLCFAATMPLVNAVLFRETSDGAVTTKVFIWAPVAWALVGWALTGWRVTRKSQGDGSDCLYFAAALSVLMALGCFLLDDQATAGHRKNPGGGSLRHARTDELPVVHSHQHGDRRFDAVLFPRLGTVHAGHGGFEPPCSGRPWHWPKLRRRPRRGSCLKHLTDDAGYKWTLTIGAACWLLLYAIYVLGTTARADYRVSAVAWPGVCVLHHCRTDVCE